MTLYHAVMIDETGCEFGAEVEASSRDDAYDQLEEMYPESNVNELKSISQWDSARRDMKRHIERGGDWDNDGRPIFHYTHDDDGDY